MTKWKDCRRQWLFSSLVVVPELARKYCIKHVKYMPVPLRDPNPKSLEYDARREDYGFRRMNVFRSWLISDVVQTGRVWQLTA